MYGLPPVDFFCSLQNPEQAWYTATKGGNKPMPRTQKTPQISVLRFRVPHSYRKAIEQISAEEGMCFSEIIRMALREFIANRQHQLSDQVIEEEA